MVTANELRDLPVPPLTLNEIAAEADSVLAMYANLYGEAMCSPIDVDELAVNVVGLTVMFAELRELLGPDVDGAIYFSRMQISIEERLNPEVFPELYGRYRFTLAHELGHWVLHRQFVMSDKTQQALCGDNSTPDIICRSKGRRPRIERQADQFAGCLLMPEWLLRPAWKDFTGGELPIDDATLGTLVPRIDPKRMAIDISGVEKELNPIRLMREVFCEPLARQFAVSDEAMRIQLESLGLLIKSSSHPSLR